MMAAREFVPDPGFDDPTAWDITTYEGSAEITDSALVCTNWRGNVTCTMHVPQPGELFDYRLDVKSVNSAGLAAVQYGTAAGIWTGAYGRGVFEGVVSGDDQIHLNIAIALGTGSMILRALSISQEQNTLETMVRVGGWRQGRGHR